jgi:hypothetical protein
MPSMAEHHQGPGANARAQGALWLEFLVLTGSANTRVQQSMTIARSAHSLSSSAKHATPQRSSRRERLSLVGCPVTQSATADGLLQVSSTAASPAIWYRKVRTDQKSRTRPRDPL